MAHELDMSNGRVNMAYIGAKPWWHSKDLQGQEMQPDSTLDQWRIGSGLDWKAEKVPMFYDHNGQLIQASDYKIKRSDTGAELGTVAKGYKVVQPDVVVEFFRDFVEVNGFTLETMGSLDQGKKIWALAKVADGFTLPGGDKTAQYLMLATSFDKTLATQAAFTSVRIVCNNTLQMSYKENNLSSRVRITHATEFDSNKAKIDLGVHIDKFGVFAEECRKLSLVKVSDEDARKVIVECLVPDEDKRKDMSTRQSNIITNVFELYKGKGMGSQLEAANGSLWGVLNAITEHVDHHVGHNLNNRIRNAWFGQGNTLKQASFQHIMKLAA